MGRVITNGRPGDLPPEQIRIFLNQHIPYRLRLLQIGRAVSPASGLIDFAMVESGLILGRQLLQFLGLGITHNPALTLCARTDYHTYKKGSQTITEEVKITDIGGRFVDVDAIPAELRNALAVFHNAASKATAHMTDGTGHRIPPEIYCEGCEAIIALVTTHLR